MNKENEFVSIKIKTLPRLNKIALDQILVYKDIEVPLGYISDGLTKLINKYPPNCLRAAIIHDYVCETECIPRKIGDEYFYEILLLDGVKKARARWFYSWVSVYRVVKGTARTVKGVFN